MTTREHAVDPSTLDPEQWVEMAHHSTHLATRVRSLSNPEWDAFRIVAVLHRADECPAEQWRQVTPEEVREGWYIEVRPSDHGGCIRGHERGGWIEVGGGMRLALSGLVGIGYGWTLWTNEPADPQQERRRLIEAATGRNAETLEANLAEYGLAIVEVDRG